MPYLDIKCFLQSNYVLQTIINISSVYNAFKKFKEKKLEVFLSFLEKSISQN